MPARGQADRPGPGIRSLPKGFRRPADDHRMVTEAARDSDAMVLDDQVIRVYAREISEQLTDVSGILIFDADGALKWSNLEGEADKLPSSAPTPEIRFDAPAKRPLSSGDVAYDFPLLKEDARALMLRIILRSLDPPSLRHVSDAIASSLDCLSRQIRIDTSLTSRIVLKEDKRRGLALVARINAAELSGNFQDDVQSLVDICRETAGCALVAVQLPVRKLSVSSSSMPGIAPFLGSLGARLLAKQQEKRRPMSVQLKLPDGKEYNALCAPIMLNHRTVEGLVILVDAEKRSWHSSAARTLSAKIATMGHDESLTTSLGNRIDLLKSIDDTLSRQTRLSHSVIYFDIDRMHAINDAFGYSGGDRALSRCKQIFLDCAGANDTAAHLGGDRFALFLPGATGDTATAKAEQVLRSISQETIENERKAISLSASAGIACSDAVSNGAEELLILAEVASRGAQDRGGGQCASYQNVDSSIIQRRSDVDKVGFLQTALIEDRFTLHAQKIEAINTEPSQKYELLARLRDDEGGNGSAHQFLAAAERYQMMAALDRWVINSALKTLSEADNSLEVNLSSFCINVSAQSLQDDAFVDHIEARIADTGIPPDILCFELTETSLVRYIDRAQRFIARVQRLGCQVALDDFGTGYSSLAYLKTLPVNILKIDGSFVRDILECSLSKTIVSSVVRIADDVGALTVAEHVENEMVRSLLKDLGVHYGQGYVVHRQEPLEDVLASFDNPAGHADDLCESINLRSETLEILLAESQQ